MEDNEKRCIVEILIRVGSFIFLLFAAIGGICGIMCALAEEAYLVAFCIFMLFIAAMPSFYLLTMALFGDFDDDED